MPEFDADAVQVAVPRKGRPLEAVLNALAGRDDVTLPGGDFDDVADTVISTLRYEKAITKGKQTPDRGLYDRLATYSDLDDSYHPDFSLLRDNRAGKPPRIVFDSLIVRVAGVDIHLVGREEPFRALRTHEFPLGFDSADLVLEEVVTLAPDPLERIADLNARIDPHDTDVRVVSGLGDTVYHTLLATPETKAVVEAPLTRAFVGAYEGPICISPRYERLVEAILGTAITAGVKFVYPDDDATEETAIGATGVGVYLTETGSTAREHGLVIGEQLFPSETVLLENQTECDERAHRVAEALVGEVETALVL